MTGRESSSTGGRRSQANHSGTLCCSCAWKGCLRDGAECNALERQDASFCRAIRGSQNNEGVCIMPQRSWVGVW